MIKHIVWRVPNVKHRPEGNINVLVHGNRLAKPNIKGNIAKIFNIFDLDNATLLIFSLLYPTYLIYIQNIILGIEYISPTIKGHVSKYSTSI